MVAGAEDAKPMQMVVLMFLFFCQMTHLPLPRTLHLITTAILTLT